MSGGAAERDGTVMVGDVIIAVDDREVIGEPLAVLRSLILGQQGSTVKLSLQRREGAGLKDHLNLTCARACVFVFAYACLATEASLCLRTCLSRPKNKQRPCAPRSRTFTSRSPGAEVYQYDVKLMRGTAEYFQSLSASRSMEDEIDQLRLQLRQALAHCSQDRDELDRLRKVSSSTCPLHSLQFKSI